MERAHPPQEDRPLTLNQQVQRNLRHPPNQTWMDENQSRPSSHPVGLKITPQPLGHRSILSTAHAWWHCRWLKKWNLSCAVEIKLSNKSISKITSNKSRRRFNHSLGTSDPIIDSFMTEVPMILTPFIDLHRISMDCSYMRGSLPWKS